MNVIKRHLYMKNIWKEAVLLCSLILLFQISAVGVFAWLNDIAGPVENIFTSSKVNIDIEETDTNDGDDNRFTNTYEIRPEEDITKDPKVSVPAGSADCWVFIKVEKSNNFDKYMHYEMDTGWKSLGEKYPGIYFMEVYTSEEEQTFSVIAGDNVKVQESVTKEMLNYFDEEPTLKITAYAIQQASLSTAETAWNEVTKEK